MAQMSSYRHKIISMKVQVCTERSCKSKFSSYIITRLENDIQKFDLKDLKVQESWCMGNCKKSPNVMFDTERQEYMTPVKASKKALDSIKK